jgi:Ca-activated chloride channel family protein
VKVRVATIVVALDVSRSMAAKDVTPNRVSAAKDAATAFVQKLPPNFRVGLVLFAGSAAVEAAPTTDRSVVVDGIRKATLSDGTAIGEAIIKSLDAIAGDAGLQSNGDLQNPKYPRMPFAAVVVMSDGETNSGRPNGLGVAAAKSAEVPVSTIAFGTDSGTIEPNHEAVPVNEAALQKIADDSSGHFFRAVSSAGLQSAFRNIGLRLTHRSTYRDVTQWFVGAALVLGVLTALLSLSWFSRLP